MRQGLFPSQQRALRQAFKKADAFDHFRQRTRRAFLSLAALAVGTGVAGFVTGRSWHAAADDPPTSPLQRYRALATGPFGDLHASHLGFLAAMEEATGDERFWVGFERLATHGLRESDRALLRRLLATARAVPAPAGYAWIAQRVKDR